MLIDTHVFLWAIKRPELISRRARDILTSRDSECMLSTASLWEIALKSRAGKLDTPDEASFFTAHIEALGLRILPVQLAHVERVFQLPDHHRDPFDRLLVAQAQVEGLQVITSDSAFRKYDVKVVW